MALLPYLRLLRAGTLFSPGCDVIAGACVLAHLRGTGSPWSADLALAAAASVSLYAAGMVCNDVADVAEDRAHRPERPIPSGAIGRAQAALLGLVLLALALLLSPCLTWHAGMAVLVLGYDFVWKSRPLFAATTMGVLRAANLGVFVAASAATGGTTLAVPTELWTACACYGVYVFAVTILGHYEDTPAVRPRAVAAIQTAPPLAALGGLLAVQGGLWPAPAMALLPVLAFARRNRLRQTWDQAAIRQSMGFLLLGTMLYTALLAVAAHQWIAGLGIAACIPAARAVGKRLRAVDLT